MTIYKAFRVMSPRLVTLQSTHYGRQIWNKCTVRKWWRCAVTGDVIKDASEAWRPITNAVNRSDRISTSGMAKLVRRAMNDEAIAKFENAEKA